jgi:Phage P22-like portal protein
MEQKDIEDFIKEHGAEAEYNSLKEGKYELRVKAGLPYQTAREENNAKFTVFLQTIGSQPTPQNLLERYFVAKGIDGFEDYTEILRQQCINAGLIKADKDEVNDVKEAAERARRAQENSPAFKLAAGKINLETVKANTEQLKQKTEWLKQLALAEKMKLTGVQIHKEIEELLHQGVPEEGVLNG